MARFGLSATGRLLDLLAPGDSGADEVALAFHDWQQRVLAIYFRESCSVDAEIGGRIRASLTGGQAPGTAPDVELPADHPITSEELARASGADLGLFRALVRALHMMDDERRVASTEVAARVRQVLAAAD